MLPQTVEYDRRLRARRIDLGFLQSQAAEQIGVHELTITNWEGNAAQPSVQHIPAIIHFLGYNRLLQAITISERLIVVRGNLGLTQRHLANRLGVDPSTIEDWNAGRHKPSPRKRELLTRVFE